MRLLEKVTNGATIEISYTGTSTIPYWISRKTVAQGIGLSGSETYSRSEQKSRQAQESVDRKAKPWIKPVDSGTLFYRRHVRMLPPYQHFPFSQHRKKKERIQSFLYVRSKTDNNPILNRYFDCVQAWCYCWRQGVP